MRARWTIDRAVVYAMAAWVQASETLSLEQADIRLSRAIRMWEFQSISTDNDYLGLILNVFDLDGDGQAEILMSVTGYESRNLELVVYRSPAEGPRRVVTRYGDGC